ncbi:MAG: type II toxin-antitoxin system VapC family toxin [Pirellulales bacterium]
MIYVLDSNIALKWALPEPDSARAILLRDRLRQGVVELLAPDFFPLEVAHALARAERRGIIQPPQGAQLLTDLLAARPQLHPSLPLLPRAFELASSARIGVYDCAYVALAEQEQCELVTADARLLNALGATFPFIVDLASIP